MHITTNVANYVKHPEIIVKDKKLRIYLVTTMRQPLEERNRLNMWVS